LEEALTNFVRALEDRNISDTNVKR
jgi:hypothetical protein